MDKKNNVQTSFSYYEKIILDRHLRFASEIAFDLKKDFEITTLTGKPATLFVSAYLNSRLREKNLPSLYYHGKEGMIQVFQNESDIADSFWKMQFNPRRKSMKGTNKDIVVLKINNKNYKLLVPRIKTNNTIEKEERYVA